MYYRIFFLINKGNGLLFDAFYNHSIPDDINFNNINQGIEYLNNNKNRITKNKRWYVILPVIYFD
jgi:hypothetical protein